MTGCQHGELVPALQKASGPRAAQGLGSSQGRAELPPSRIGASSNPRVVELVFYIGSFLVLWEFPPVTRLGPLATRSPLPFSPLLTLSMIAGMKGAPHFSNKSNVSISYLASKGSALILSAIPFLDCQKEPHT